MDTVDSSDCTDHEIKKKKAKKTFSCQICMKSFRANYQLKRHEIVHIRAGELQPSELEPQEQIAIADKVVNSSEDQLNASEGDIYKRVEELLSQPGSSETTKVGNPWDLHSIYDLSYFCCPECEFKHQDKQDFVSHASNNHPWVSFLMFYK